MQLQGCYTAIVTPFANGSVDFAALRDLVERQVAGGVTGVVPVGTTGESPTLDFDDHDKVIETVIETVNGRCQVIAGTGGNSTDEAIRLTKHAKEAGADATLQVTPYYNKPTQEGLYQHFSKVADIGLPVVLYNVPGRSGVPIAVETVARLASHPYVVAVKEAGGSADRVSQILNCCEISVLSGDDSLTLPMMVLGAKGVISVASNVIPAKVQKLTELALAGKFAEARELHFQLYDFFNVIFVETNPIPIKAACAAMGWMREEYRLPMCPMAPANKEKLLKVMRTDLGLDV